MRSYRVSIAQILLLIVACGMAMGALLSPGGVAGLILFALILASLAVGLLAAIVLQPGRRRTFWIGYAVLGWSYLVLTLGPTFTDTIGPSLFTTKLIRIWYAALNSRPAPPVDYSTSFLAIRGSRLPYMELLRLTHTMFAALSGLVGAGLALWLTREPRQPEPPPLPQYGQETPTETETELTCLIEDPAFADEPTTMREIDA